jgi:predicted ATPase
MRRNLARHDLLIEQLVAQHGGTLVRPRGEGDSRFAVFARASDAIAAACAMQILLIREPWALPEPLRVRMAAHTGESELRLGDYYGPAVNHCARLRATAHGGQVVVSTVTADLVPEALAAELTLRDLGEHRLKDLERPEHIWQVVHPELPTDFPPLLSLRSRWMDLGRKDEASHASQKNNLRAQPTPLIGRDRLLPALVDALHNPKVRLLTLSGAPGTGKTRLALALAEATLSSFADGVYFVDLAPLSEPSQVLETIARTLYVERAGAVGAAEQLIDVIGVRRMLLVLDNFEHVATAATEAADLLASCQHLKIVVTSRESLRLRWEHAVPVPPLELPDLATMWDARELETVPAVRLFVERVRQTDPAFALTERNCRIVASICVRVDGLPLSIELAAARTRALGVQGVLDRVSQRLDVLAGGTREQPPRHQTLRAAIRWSHELLSLDEQQVFRRLAVFAGSWLMAAAEAICPVEGGAFEDIADVMDRLVQRSLVQVQPETEPIRYRLLETVRQFALEQLEASAELREIRQRHCSWYVGVAESVKPELLDPNDIDRLECDYDNLRSALNWAIDSGDADAALRLGIGLWLYWYTLGQYTAGRTHLSAALAVPSTAGDAPLRAVALSFSAHLAYCQGDFATALGLLEQATSTSMVLRDLRALGLARQVHGNVLRAEGNLEGASALYAEALRLNREVGNWAWEAVNLHLRAGTVFELGRAEEAEDLASNGLSISERHNLAFAGANARQTLGVIASARGDYATAQTNLEEALQIQRELRYRQGLILTLIALVTVAWARGNTAEALEYVGECIRLARDSGDRLGLARSFEVAAACRVSSDARTALLLVGAADALRAQVVAGRSPNEQRRVESILGDAANRSSLVAYDDAAPADGRRLTVDEAVELAISHS